MLRDLQALAFDEGTKWMPADDLPERRHVTTATGLVVVAAVEVPCAVATAFRAFTDPAVYSQWLGVPVTIEQGRFAATMEWGTHIRGRYEVVSEPSLIAMRWDFDDQVVPVPGRELVAYARFSPTAAGTQVEVHQHARDHQQATFMEAAWGVVLGRLRESLAADSPFGGNRRPPRPKRTTAR